MGLKKAELEVRNFIKRIEVRREKTKHMPINKKQEEKRQNLRRLLSSDFNGLEINVEIICKR